MGVGVNGCGVWEGLALRHHAGLNLHASDERGLLLVVDVRVQLTSDRGLAASHREQQPHQGAREHGSVTWNSPFAGGGGG
jgi:hypothetical protein